MVAENVKHIRERIALACQRSTRRPEDVTLIAVSKSFGIHDIREATAAGVTDIGENYVQELRQKYEKLEEESIRWHFIGHLQSNKVKYIAPWINCIHAVDSERLGREISKQAQKSSRNIDIFIEVNTTGERSKFGVYLESCRQLIDNLKGLPAIRVAGLMTIGPFFSDPEKSRPAYKMLRNLREDLNNAGVQISHLSMGMSADFEIAIEEGATMIRIGTGIFGQRTSKNMNR